MDSEDDDMFGASDDESNTFEANNISSSYNPINEHLMKQMIELEEQIQSVTNQIADADTIFEKIITKIEKDNTTLDYDDSDSDKDFDMDGQPSMKRKKRRSTQSGPLIEIKEIWQRIVIDKWVIGIDMENKSNRTLSKLKFYLMISGETEFNGIVSFWCLPGNSLTDEQTNESLWERTNEINYDVANFTATAVLNIPNFDKNNPYNVSGAIFYSITDDKNKARNLQIPVSDITLSLSDISTKKLIPRYCQNRLQSVLSVKASGIEKIVYINLSKERIKFFNFLEKNDLHEILSDVYITKNTDSFRHWLLEVLLLSDNQIQVTITAPSIASMNVILNLIREGFPDKLQVIDDDTPRDAAWSLGRELDFKYRHTKYTLHEILQAKVITDLLIPD